MFVLDGAVVYSASDLAAAARCEYAVLRAFDAKLGWGPAVSADDELLARTVELGGEHERRHLDQLRSAVADETGENVVVIGRPRYTIAGLTAAADATRDAVQRRAPAIFQAAMFDGRFVGFADFLVLDGAQYRLRDTKLARSVKVEALLQLAAYADTLARQGIPVAPEVELVLGDGAVASYRTDELLPVYGPRRDALQRLLDGHLAGGRAVAWEDEGVRACLRCAECETQVRAHDDLLLVAGMRVSQRARLIDAGITTAHDLAGHRGPVPELSARAVTALTAQARLQVADRVDGKPPYDVVDPQPLMVLPDANKGDLFFDFEGDPLWTVDGREWGLEYLWGVLTVGDDFQPFWAHDRPGERQALIDFEVEEQIAFVRIGQHHQRLRVDDVVRRLAVHPVGHLQPRLRGQRRDRAGDSSGTGPRWPARSCAVVMPESISRARWLTRMPATSNRSSCARTCVSHSAQRKQARTPSSSHATALPPARCPSSRRCSASRRGPYTGSSSSVR